MTIISEPPWDSVAEDLLKYRGTSIIIGANDSGKSTLARYLIKRLVSTSLKVCFIDSDVGQSSLGLPGTISMKVFRQREEGEFHFGKMCFIGAVNPAKRIPIIIEASKRFADVCREESDITLLDTSGLVSGELGRILKVGKVRAVGPRRIIALQRQRELEHILTALREIKIFRLEVSKAATVRSPAVRAQYRKRKLEVYFAETKMQEFMLRSDEAKFFYNRRPVQPDDKTFKKGTIIGLNHDEDTLALGVLEEISYRSVIFTSPIKSLKKVDKVVFGDMTKP